MIDANHDIPIFVILRILVIWMPGVNDCRVDDCRVNYCRVNDCRVNDGRMNNWLIAENDAEIYIGFYLSYLVIY